MEATLNTLRSPPDGLFWSEPFALDSDFTKEDPLALDYLAQQVGLWLFLTASRLRRAGRSATRWLCTGLHLVSAYEHGHPRLCERLAGVTALMRTASSWRSYRQSLNVVNPKFGTPCAPFPFNDPDDWEA